MSNKSRKKGKEPAKAVFVESSAQMTKSRNMAEENILRHKLKGLEDQKRRSILAMKEEEKILIKDLETSRRGSQSLQASDIEKFNAKYSNGSRRGSYISSDENDNTLISSTHCEANNDRRSSGFNSKLNENNDADSRKHLWKCPKSSSIPSRDANYLLNNANSKKFPGRTASESDRLHISDIVKEFSLGHDNTNNSNSIVSVTDKINGSSQNNDSLSRPRNRTMASSRSILSRAKSIDINCLESPRSNNESADVWPDNTRVSKDNRPSKPRTKSEERRDRSLKTLNKPPDSLKWSSFEDFDKELSSAYGMIDKHEKKLSRSVNKTISELNEKKSPSSSILSKSTSDYKSLNSSLTKSIKQLSNSLQNCTLLSQETDSACADASFKNGDNKLKRRPSTNKCDSLADPHRKSRQHTNHTEILNNQNDTISSMPPQTDSKTPKPLTERRNSVGRNKILLSPLARRTPKLESNGYTPTCSENKRTVKKVLKTRRSISDKVEPLRFTTANQITSDSESGGSNVSRRGSIPDTTPRCSTSKLSVRPVSSWSQRKRSIVFGEKSPQTAREVLNDTQAQWEELGDFLGEIRKQHNMDHSTVSSARQAAKAVYAPQPPPPESQSRRGSSSFANLVDQRLLPRRHSESNIILLSHAAQGGKKDLLDVRRGSVVPRQGRRKSCIPPDQSCDIMSHGNTTSTSVKKLVTIHNALQSSALSMADMESEMF